ncbi:ABC transporter permease [Chloroflexota bacterium]
MSSFFGIPINTMMIALLVIFGLSAAVLTVIALRNRVMFKMAARNLPRRRANTILTVLGLMLAAVIFSASLTTGDTLSHSIRTMALKDLGQVDVMVVREGVDAGFEHGQTGLGTSYFDKQYFQQVQQALSDEPSVEGVAPAIIESVPVVSKSKLNEPSVDFLGVDSQYIQAFDPMLDEDGNTLLIQNLDGTEIYISEDLADSLEVGNGDQIDVFLGEEAIPFVIKGIYKEGGNPSGNLSMVTSLSQLQTLRASDEINYILITNKGGLIDGASHTDTVIGVLESEEVGLATAGLKVEPVKQDALELADEVGSGFSSVFLIFGSFSIIAGILLIFLIFVMLAAERKRELGIARAVGSQRGHILRLFTFEGVLYALIASAIGSVLGILFGMGMIEIMAVAFEDMGAESGFQMEYHLTGTSMIISYTLGVVMTLAIVIFSAWRVGRLNIVRAIRDIPEPQNTGGRGIKGLIISILLPLLGILFLANGLQAKQFAPYTLGASLFIIGVCLLARRLRLPDRAAYTLAGVGLLLFWLLPFDYHPYYDEMTSGIEMFILSGIFLVGGAVWVVMYNSDLLLRGIMSLFGRIRLLAPVLKTAVSYPMASRFRTGMALALFSLIVFTLVMISVINASFSDLLSDTERVSGGFHISSDVNYNNPITNIDAALNSPDGVGLDNFKTIASQNRTMIKARQADKGYDWEDFYITGVDAEYTNSIPYSFDMVTESYPTKEEVWMALQNNPSMVVLSSAMVPSHESDMMEEGPDHKIGEGDFYIEDGILPDNVFIETINPLTGYTQKLHVIGVIETMAGPYAAGITTSQETVNTLAGYAVPPTSYLFKVTPERIDNVPDIAKGLEKQFLENGMNAAVMAEEVKQFSEMNQLFFNLITVFMGLGLIVGIAALGVIAARSVVERRQQIGVLRAIGFQRGMVQFSFLAELSFIALMGIGIGVALGIALSYQIIPDTDIEGIKTIIPWGRIALIVGVAYIFSLLTTYLPARQASKVYPAEALRYE